MPTVLSLITAGKYAMPLVAVAIRTVWLMPTVLSLITAGKYAMPLVAVVWK